MAAAATEIIQIESESDEELFGTNSRRCCLWMPCIGSEHDTTGRTVRSNWWERITASTEKDDSVHWWSKGFDAIKKLREWSELVAGPKWKTFIRRFNKIRPTAKQGKFQYDPLSYALNFDDGNGGQIVNFEEGRDFSSRFASIPASAKSSMDLVMDAPKFM